MRCPNLVELPSPPAGKIGWPWTEESPQLPATMPDGSSWPRISIVTPSFNQGQFIEETIRSVLLQGYPNLEYIVIDGGSTDGGVEVIKKYAPWLAYWVSEPDNGQAQAINKGLKRTTGAVLAWLNSDDIYLSDALYKAIDVFAVSGYQVVMGDAIVTDQSSQTTGKLITRYLGRGKLLRFWSCQHPELPSKWWISQPGVFFTRAALNKVGLLDEELFHVMDYDLWIRLSEVTGFFHINEAVATYRFHAASKSITNKKWSIEGLKVSKKYWGSPFSLMYWRCWVSHQTWQLKQTSQPFYFEAFACWQENNRAASLGALLKAFAIFPLNLFSGNHVTLTLRNLFGNRVYDWIKMRLRLF